MAIIFRTPGLWGAGKGSNLLPEEVDQNFYYLLALYTAIQDHLATAAVSIAGISVHGDQLTFDMTDGTTQGPFTLPTSSWNGRGPWTPLTVYFVNDIFDVGGALYRVTFDHTSLASFDPGQVISGHIVYQLILQPPAAILPTGGTIGQVLKKASATDYAVLWADQNLADLSDVALGSPLAADDFLVWNGVKWTNQALVKEQQLLQTTTQDVASVAHILDIDRSLGEIVRVSLTENISAVNVTNWAPDGFRGKIEIQATNTASFTFGGLPVTAWANSTAWAMSPGAGKLDRVLMTSDNAGATVLGDVVGQNYG